MREDAVIRGLALSVALAIIVTASIYYKSVDGAKKGTLRVKKLPIQSTIEKISSEYSLDSLYNYIGSSMDNLMKVPN